MSFSATGVPKAVDWVVFPDWYELPVHWRGYTPEGALGNDWWHTLQEYIVPVGAEYRAKEKVVEWRMNKIQHLQGYIETMINTLPIRSNHIPTPKMEDLSELAKAHPSEVGVFHVMARSHSHFTDLAGFFCYLCEVFVEFFEDGELDTQIPPAEIWLPWTKQKKTGYILNLPKHWKTLNIPMWLAHSIPLHYHWSDTISADPRFSRLDPEFLQAHDEDLLGPYNATAVHSVYFDVQEGSEYDELLQTRFAPGYNHPHLLFQDDETQLANVDFHFKDYEEWASRPIDNTLEGKFLSEIFYFKDHIDKGTRKRSRQGKEGGFVGKDRHPLAFLDP